MEISRLRVMQMFCLILILAWLWNVIAGFNQVLYGNIIIYNKPELIGGIVGYIVGILIGLIYTGGLTFLFWYSYWTRFKEEKVFDCILKKFFSFLIATIAIYSVFLIPIFKMGILFTLVIFIKRYKKELLEIEQNI